MKEKKSPDSAGSDSADPGQGRPPKTDSGSVEHAGGHIGVGWWTLAACRGMGPSMFYPEKGGDFKSPKAVCEGCEVKAACLEAALINSESGVWGGTTEQARGRTKRNK